jgi:uncharacterized protein YjiK
VYTFNLNEGKPDKQPLFSIKLSDPVFKGKSEGKFNPSEIELHPSTGEYYILDAENQKIVIAEKNGRPMKLELLAEEDFSKPEGLTFTPDGTLYISNEAGDGPANILQVNLR